MRPWTVFLRAENAELGEPTQFQSVCVCNLFNKIVGFFLVFFFYFYAIPDTKSNFTFRLKLMSRVFLGTIAETKRLKYML